MTTGRNRLEPNRVYQTWAFTNGPDHHNPAMTHAAVTDPNGVMDGKTLCGRSMYGYLETDLTRYGIRCRACAKSRALRAAEVSQ